MTTHFHKLHPTQENFTGQVNAYFPCHLVVTQFHILPTVLTCDEYDLLIFTEEMYKEIYSILLFIVKHKAIQAKVLGKNH